MLLASHNFPSGINKVICLSVCLSMVEVNSSSVGVSMWMWILQSPPQPFQVLVPSGSRHAPVLVSVEATQHHTAQEGDEFCPLETNTHQTQRNIVSRGTFKSLQWIPKQQKSDGKSQRDVSSNNYWTQWCFSCETKERKASQEEVRSPLRKSLNSTMRLYVDSTWN